MPSKLYHKPDLYKLAFYNLLTMCFSISLLLGDSLASMTFLPPSLLTIGPSIFTTKNKRIASQWERGGKGRRKREREGEGVWGPGEVEWV